jgi:Spy/CpxP family protein refolding chaperone
MKGKTMFNKIFQLLIIAFVSITMVNCSSKDNNAQSRANNPGMRRLQVMQEELDLTDSQVKEIEKIFEDSRDKMMEARDQAMGDRSKMMELMLEMRKENDKKIEDLLTNEQKEKFEEYKQERDERIKQRMGQRGGMQ